MSAGYSNMLIRGFAAGLVLLAAGCTSPRPQPVPATQPQPAMTAPEPPSAEERDFNQFIQDFRAYAQSRGITAQTYDHAMGTVRYNPRIVSHTVSQPEFVKPVWEYVDGAVTPRIGTGKAHIAQQAAFLSELESRYGVPKEILVSIWGNETDFGHVSGRYNLFTALAALSFRGPRAGFGRTQLIAALTMVQRDGMDPAAMTASWAGAFGQTQFEPTSYLAHAVDGDGDGRIDLWHSSADALASTASLLTAYGWTRGLGWGYEVKLPLGFSYEQADPDRPHAMADWRARGVTTATGAPLPPLIPTLGGEEAKAAIFVPAGADGPAFLLTPNFRAILRYNNAAAYALAVCLLADRLGDAPPMIATWPRTEQPLSREQRLTLQRALLARGFTVGVVDGVIGSNTRSAIRDFQLHHGMVADGFATLKLLQAIEATQPAAAAQTTTVAPATGLPIAAVPQG